MDRTLKYPFIPNDYNTKIHETLCLSGHKTCSEGESLTEQGVAVLRDDFFRLNIY